MINICLKSLRQTWPFIQKTSLSSQILNRSTTLKEVHKLKVCCYCKRYGLYDDEDESYGEVNSRGTFVENRPHREWRTRGNSFSNYGYRNGPNNRQRGPNYDEYDDDDEGYDNNFYGGNEYPPRNAFSQRRDRYPPYRQSSGFENRPYRNRQFNARPGFGHQKWSLNENSFSERLQDVTYDQSKLPSIEKNFYVEHADVAARSQEEVEKYCKLHNITVKGYDVPKPILQFNELTLPASLMQVIKEEKFPNPTPIQAQGWPVALSGRNMIGISQTGSGKTLVFALPAMVHIMNQPKNRENASYACTPQALVLAPTRELAQQIYGITYKFRHSCGIRSSCVFGGASKYAQLSRLKGCELCVATPGRLIDFLSEGSVNLGSCTYLVLDEADRMLDMGFEPQIRQIIGQIRPDRQTLMWSATWPKDVQNLANDFIDDYVHITIGAEHLFANPNIQQNFHFITDFEKEDRLILLMNEITKMDGKVIVFAQTKRTVDLLANRLNRSGVFVMAIHGDVSQSRRDSVLNKFRNEKSAVLIATDVAARGIDVHDVSHVINFDMPLNIEDYIHRIGRTARGTQHGVAHSFFTPADTGVAKDLKAVLQESKQPIPSQLQNLTGHGNSMRRYNTKNSRPWQT